jgi:hypothetical protein
LGLSFPLPCLSIGGLDVCLDFFFLKKKKQNKKQKRVFLFPAFIFIICSVKEKEKEEEKKKGRRAVFLRLTATGAGPQVNYGSLDFSWRI